MSAARPDTWMPLYIGDYLQDTMHLTAEQHGAYLLLIMACWKRGGLLPSDDAQLAAITRLNLKSWREHKPIISEFFQITSDGWKQKRIDRELTRAIRVAEIKRAAGHRGGIAAKGKSGRKPSSNGIAEEWQNH